MVAKMPQSSRSNNVLEISALLQFDGNELSTSVSSNFRNSDAGMVLQSLQRCTGTSANRANITLRHKWRTVGRVSRHAIAKAHTNVLTLSLMIYTSSETSTTTHKDCKLSAATKRLANTRVSLVMQSFLFDMLFPGLKLICFTGTAIPKPRIVLMNLLKGAVPDTCTAAPPLSSTCTTCSREQ